MTPLVSIIIPYYNRPIKLERCLNSVLSQSYSHYEVIVVDDCSTLHYQKQHEQVKYLTNEINSGPGVSRNLGMEHATGEFIVFLDCDDYWHKDFLKSVVPVLVSHPEACMAYTNGLNIDEKCKIIGSRRKKTIYPTTILPNILHNGRHWGTGSCLWRASIVKNVQFFEHRSWEDYAFDVSVGIKNNCVIPIKENLVFYDASGDDKISKNNEEKLIKEKNKSIVSISKLLLAHNYKYDSKVKKSITILIILNTIRLIKLGIRDEEHILMNLKNIRQWQNIRFYIYMLCILQLPKRVAMKYLKSLKRKVNQNKIYLLK